MKRSAIVLLAALALACSSCKLLDWLKDVAHDIDYPDPTQADPTNAPPVPPPDPDPSPDPVPDPEPDPTPEAYLPTRDEAAFSLALKVGPEVHLGPGRLSSIALDSRGQPHVAADGGSWLYLYDRVAGEWSVSSTNLGVVGATQFYNPHTEIDTNDVQWVSGCVFGREIGAGVVARRRVADRPGALLYAVHRLQGAWDQGNLSLETSTGWAVWYSANGHYRRFGARWGKPPSLYWHDQGVMYAGQGGEKNAFAISRGPARKHASSGSHSVWHAAINGWDEWDSTYQNSLRHERGEKPVTWARFLTYRAMQDDGCYASIAADSASPQVAYIAAAFGPGRGVCVNVWTGSHFLYPPDSLLEIDVAGSSGLRRFAPQLSPAPAGGAYLTWTRGAEVWLKYLSASGASNSAPARICAGSKSSLAVSATGKIHLVYEYADRICHRALAPKEAASSK